MRLLVIRHAIAVDRDEFAATGEGDALRPLTAEGRAKMRLATRGLRRIAPRLERLASSPFTRAWDTARIVAKRYGGTEIERVDALTPDQDPEGLVPWLRGGQRGGVVAVVGHEPHLTSLVSWLVSDERRAVLELKKGAACLVEMGDAPVPGRASLLWSLTPAQLRALGS